MADSTARSNPFVGPRPFRRRETLYGRDWESQQLADLVVASRAVLVHAPSGAGKSSLLRSGFSRECARLGLGRPIFVSVGAEPRTHVPNRYVWSAVSSLPHRGPRQSSETVTLAEAFDRWMRARLSAAALRPGLYSAPPDADRQFAPCVLLFDQFEEILTRNPTDIDAKEAFFKELALLLHNPRWWAVFAIRDDYLGALDPFITRHLPTRLRDRFRLDFLSEQAARDAIQKPAASVQVVFTPEAAARLVNDLRQVRVQGPDGVALEAGPFVEPVHLQVVCRNLFDRREQAGTISEADIDALGATSHDGAAFANGVDAALAAYYRDVIESVAGASGVQIRRLRDWMERVLISPHGLRRPVLKEGDSIEGLPARALDPLRDAYLVREDSRRGATFIELAHDRLVEPIRRDNASWRQKTLNRLQQQAPEWHAQGRPSRLLLRGRVLRDAQSWTIEHEAEVEPVERDLLDASLDTNLRRTNLAETGWAVIFPEDGDPAVRAALGELLVRRHALATRKDPRRYRDFSGAAGYRAGETAEAFLARHGASLATVRSEVVPYYLLIVADPVQIPWQVQYELARRYAVGRIWFESTVEFARYARSVVTSEAPDSAVPARAAVFAPTHRRDSAMKAGMSLLIEPLVARLETVPGAWSVETRLATRATREALTHLLGDQAPALVLALAHLIVAPDPAADIDGGLVCDTWEGGGHVDREDVFTPDDLSADAGLLGSMVLLLAASSAGRSGHDDSRKRTGRASSDRPPHVGELARRLLAHPRGGAVAVLAHVDELWITSFLFEGTHEYPLFAKIVRRLMDGHTIGSAAELLVQRYQQLQATMDAVLRRGFLDETEADVKRLELLRTAMIDARNYVVLGDPSVRLRLVSAGTTEHARSIAAVQDAGEPRFELPAAVSMRGDPAPLVVGNGVWLSSGGYSLPTMTIDTLGRLLASLEGGAAPPAERGHLTKEYVDARKAKRAK